jgi:hypothetical protein
VDVVPASVRTETEVERMVLMRVLAGWVIVVASFLVATLVIVVTWPRTVEKAVDVAKDVDRIVEVAGLRVVAWRPALVLVIVANTVGPGRNTVEVLVMDVMVWLTVNVVVPAARASSPLRNMRAPPEGAQVTVVFFVVTCVEVVDTTVVIGFGVTVLTTRAPESEITLVLLTPFCVFVMYEVCVWPWSLVIVTAFGVIVETIWTVVVALTTTGFGECVEVETIISVVLMVDGFP